MRHSKMDRRLTFQQLTEVQSATGYAAPSWADLGSNPTVWCQVIQQNGREFTEGDKVNAEIVTIFKVRYRSDITDKMRIVYAGRHFDIFHIKELGRREGLEITAKAEVQ